MNWDDVRVFLAVARAGQLLQAARRLGVNHATVARRITALEDSLRAKLLDRRTTGCVLTPEGEEFLLAAERMETEMIAARASIGETNIEVSGVVRIGAPDGFGVAYLAPRLGPLLDQYPDLTVQLVPVPRTFSLDRREADIVITVDRPVHGRLVARKLVDYSLGLFASRAYVSKYGIPEKRDDLSNHRLVGFVEDLIYSPSLNYAGEMMRGHRAQFECASALGQTEAVRAGLGIGILHGYLAREDADLVEILPQHNIQRAYWAVYHESTRRLGRISAVSDYIYQLVEQERIIFR
ncbi:LysR family transcriptional regulator [Cohaesibacter celericrescens]|uniref:LysR family transcriptional regulator n=1 Tax=Cohaesibacter celericrescens TaxID=2067669 RepID=A0A2N5XWE6_9HYPH|nr:LysR family transcriptional regulator [Cohaesibacter celericrescens]PLW78824.1 LysR family transcriptional regulator [Cohaesibacter celericrescens]